MRMECGWSQPRNVSSGGLLLAVMNILVFLSESLLVTLLRM